MNKQEQIKKIENEIEELKQEVEKLKNENKGRWIPEKNMEYYFVGIDNYVTCYRYDKDDLDKRVMGNTLIFKTEEEAKHYRDYLEALNKATYEFTKEEWENNNIDKWNIYYNYIERCFNYAVSWNWKDMRKKYFKTQEEAKAFVSKWEKEIKEYEYNIHEEV